MFGEGWGHEMVMKHLLCHEDGRFRVVPIVLLLLFFLGLAFVGRGCGSNRSSGNRQATPPRDFPALAKDRYEQVQVTIDGKGVDANTTITVGKDFDVSVSFRRLHVWPGLDNAEQPILALVFEQDREHKVTRRSPILNWQSEKNGVLTYSGKLEGLPERGVYGFYIQEAVATETLGLDRYYLFATNIRNIQP